MVKVQNGHSPGVAPAPGEKLVARLEAMEMTSSELAKIMGYPLWAVQIIISGEAVLTPGAATLLEQALDNPTNLGNDRGYGYQEFLAANPARPIRNEYNPDFVTPLGDTLEEVLEDREMTAASLAEQMGYPLSTISGIIAGDVAVTPEMAIQLERALDVPASFWNNRERRYREWLAKRTSSVAIAS